MIRIKQLVSNLSTDWKTEPSFVNIVERYADGIDECLNDEFSKHTIYPSPKQIFNAFDHFNVNELKVVIIGLDPYIREGQAMGLCFSSKHTKIPPSLKNILKEVEREYGKVPNPDLTAWAKQGVLLLNRFLTVREGLSNSHKFIWKSFTEDICKFIANEFEDIVYMLWGRDAQQIEHLIDNTKNLVLKSIHPSPLAQVGVSKFVGCGHFKSCNDYLILKNYKPIEWLS
jgi:uracil-DNA glycosylase